LKIKLPRPLRKLPRNPAWLAPGQAVPRYQQFVHVFLEDGGLITLKSLEQSDIVFIAVGLSRQHVGNRIGQYVKRGILGRWPVIEQHRLRIVVLGNIPNAGASK